MSREIRVVIADDHPIFRRGLRTVVESDPLLKVVAEADDGESALARIVELQPDVAVLDINMPPPDGLAVARRLREGRVAAEVVFLTMHRDEALLDAALDLGVKGFVVKDGAAGEVVGCVKAVAAGRSFFSPTLTGILLNRRNTPGVPDVQRPSVNDLTASERRVLSLVAEALTNREIAERMFISVRTVEHHRANICAKLGLTGRNALLTFALTHKAGL